MHVDGAYGGFFQLTERGHERFAGIERRRQHHARSAQGAVPAVRDRRARRARRRGAARRPHVGADYLQDLAPPGDLPNYSEYSPELSREFRGLRVWMPLQLHGVAAFREALDEKLDLTAHLYEALAGHPRGRGPVGAAAHDGAVPPPRAPTTRPTRRSWRASTPAKRVLPVQHDDPRPLHAARVHREPPHAPRPHRRVHRGRSARPPGRAEPAVPELPEVRALAERLTRPRPGGVLHRVDLLQFSALKTFEPRLDSLAGRTLESVGTRGKYLVFELGRAAAARAPVAGRTGGRRVAAEDDEAAGLGGAAAVRRPPGGPGEGVRHAAQGRLVGAGRGRRRAAREARARGRLRRGRRAAPHGRRQPPRPHDPARPAHARRGRPRVQRRRPAPREALARTPRSRSSTPTSASGSSTSLRGSSPTPSRPNAGAPAGCPTKLGDHFTVHNRTARRVRSAATTCAASPTSRTR